MTEAEATDELRRQMNQHLAHSVEKYRCDLLQAGCALEDIEHYFETEYLPELDKAMDALMARAKLLLNGTTVH